jgi:hypothetical protein
MLNIYKNRDINDIPYNDLLELKKKVSLSLDLIKNRKKKSNVFKINKTIIFHVNKFLNCVVMIEKINESRSNNKKLCSICYTDEIKILIKPCNHICICEECSDKIDNCPICRIFIISKEFVFFQ